MFENLLELVKQNAGDAVINNSQIPDEHNEAVINTTAKSIMNSLQGHISGGNLQDVIGMFNNGGGSLQNNPVTSNISQNLISDLMSKHGLSSGVAGSLVSSLVPIVMSQLVNKTNNPGDSSFDLQGILGALGGNSGGSTSGMFGNVLGNLFK